MREIKENKKLTFASLFSGIGGADIAATAAGWEHKFWCEWDPFCQTVLKYWFNNSIGYNDITKTDFTGWRGEIDVLHASPPCQSVSVAGKRKGEADDRFLWGDAIRALAEIRPTWFTFENVAGIETMVESVPHISMVFEDGHRGETGGITRRFRRFGILNGILDLIRLQGYSVRVFNIPACAVGAPHERKRVWIVGHLADADINRQWKRTHQQVSVAGCKETPNDCSCSQDGTTPDAGHTGPEVLRERAVEVSSGGSASDAACKQVKRDEFKQPENRAAKQMQHRGGSGEDGGFWRSEDFWRNFPSESPVCRGNDGFPIEVDSLTIPFSRWRREAVKAYGNALVPQVLYQFYNTINRIENGDV